MITAMPRIAIAVHDFPKAIALFRDQLGMPVIDFSANSVDSLGARLAMCVPEGGSNIEIMSPANPAAPLSQSLTRFLDRRGEGLFALMLEAPDPNAEADVLLRRGLNVLPLMAGAGGRDIHPKSTHGVLIRVYPVNSFSQRQARSDQGLILSGISRVIIAVRDLDHAMEIYRDQLGLATDPAHDDPIRGIRGAICRPPGSGTIKLVSVVDEEQPFAATITRFLAEQGEGMFALMLQARDLASTTKTLGSRKLETTTSDEDSIELPIDTTFGARIRIETVNW